MALLICPTRHSDELDIVVAAVHSFFDLPREAQTERVLRAMSNPHVSIIVRPTRRLWRARVQQDRYGEDNISHVGYECPWKSVPSRTGWI